MSQRWRTIGNTLSDLTGPRFDPQAFRSRDECVTVRKSWAGQIEHSVANDLPPLRHFFERSVARAQWRGDGPRKPVTRFVVLQRVQWKTPLKANNRIARLALAVAVRFAKSSGFARNTNKQGLKAVAGPGGRALIAPSVCWPKCRVSKIPRF